VLTDRTAGREITPELSTRGKESTRRDTAGSHGGLPDYSFFFWDVTPYRWMNG